MRAARLAAAYNHRKVEASDLLYESGVVQWILVNVNTAPDAGVIRPDRDNSQTRFNALEVLDPQVICWGLAHDDGLARLFSVPSRGFNFVRSMSNVQARKDRLEPGDVSHFFFL